MAWKSLLQRLMGHVSITVELSRKQESRASQSALPLLAGWLRAFCTDPSLIYTVVLQPSEELKLTPVEANDVLFHFF